MDFPWLLFLDLGIVAAALLVATALRYHLGFLQRFLIPNAITAGLLLMLFYNVAGPRLGLDTGRLEALAYHLLNLSFVAMTLRRPAEKHPQTRLRAFSIGISLLTHYAVQATIGLVLTFVFIWTLMPDLFPTFGFLLPLGFSSGPGQAFAIGQGWQRFGFSGAGSIGLTFAALGYLWACFGGIVLINRGLRRGWATLGAGGRPSSSRGVYERGAELPVGSRLTTDSIAIDGNTYTVAVVLLTYTLTYLLLRLLTVGLSAVGQVGKDFAVNLWGIGFIFAALVAMLVRRLLGVMRVEHTFDDGSLTRVAGLAVDIMVASALGAISLVVVLRFWLPILVMGTVAGVLAFWLIPAVGRWIYPDHKFGRMLIVYGAATGTLATGLALLRVVDPDFRTPVATDYMYASAMVFVLAIPLILMINLPAYAYLYGRPGLYWLSLGICLAYVAFVAVAQLLLARAVQRRTATAAA
jgi:ESS family glutamate:Na+ symporter